MNLLILLLIALQSNQIMGQEKFEVKQLDNDEVIYLETLSKVQSYHEEWKIVIGYDLSDLKTTYEILNRSYNRVRRRCFHWMDNSYTQWSCEDEAYIKSQLEVLEQTAKAIENVRDLARRYDFDGKINKSLSETLSKADASYYNSELDKLHAVKRNIVQNVKNKTSIMLKSFETNELNETSSSVNNYLDKQMIKIGKLSQVNEANKFISNAILLLDLKLDELIEEIRHAEELISDGNHVTGISYILPSQVLFKILREYVPTDTLEIDLKKKLYTTLLINISKISIVMTEKRLLIQLVIPLLTESKPLDLTRVISLPRHDSSRQSIVDTTQSLILMVPNTTTFMPISGLEIDSAKNLSKYMLLKRKYFDNKVGVSKKCLTEILTTRNTESCRIKYMQIQNTLWIPLYTNRDWIGIAPKEELLPILCSDKILHTVRVYRNFVLHLEPGCKVISYAGLVPDTVFDDKIKISTVVIPLVGKTIRLIGQKSINETFLNFYLTDIPMKTINETYIDPEILQTLGDTQYILKDLAEKEKTYQFLKENIPYLASTGCIVLGFSLYVFLYKIGVFKLI